MVTISICLVATVALFPCQTPRLYTTLLVNYLVRPRDTAFFFQVYQRVELAEIRTGTFPGSDEEEY